MAMRSAENREPSSQICWWRRTSYRIYLHAFPIKLQFRANSDPRSHTCIYFALIRKGAQLGKNTRVMRAPVRAVMHPTLVQGRGN